jgi:hypothetical protein
MARHEGDRVLGTGAVARVLGRSQARFLSDAPVGAYTVTLLRRKS